MTHHQCPHLYIVAERKRKNPAGANGNPMVFTGRWVWVAFGPDGGRPRRAVAPSYADALRSGQYALASLTADDHLVGDWLD